MDTNPGNAMLEGQNPALAAFAEKLTKEMYPDAKAGHCLECKEPFSEKNIYSEAGWREAKMSQLCEKCFDKMFAEDEEDESSEEEPAF